MSKKIAFTICSNNYLGQAKILTDSLAQYSPDYLIYIILCDKKHHTINYSLFHAEIVEVERLDIKNFTWMTKNYNIVELNTAIKPFAFQYFLKQDVNLVCYFDPDICIYHSLNIIEKELVNFNILLTPHSFAPLAIDGHVPNDTTFLNYGIYNLGFCALKNNCETDKMLTWWCNILEKNCYNLPAKGLFVDQLPINLVPLYFDGVKVSKNKGLNVSWWNLHERKVVTKIDGSYLMDNGDKLCFFHFSNYKLSNPNEISIPQRYSRSILSEDCFLSNLYKDYYNKMINTIQILQSNRPCFYGQRSLKDKLKFKIKRKLAYYTQKLADIYIGLQ